VSVHHEREDESADPSPGTAWHSPGERIVIISASVGAGHDGAAAEIARRLAASGYRVDHRDFVDLIPGHAGKLLRVGYRRLLALAPSGYHRFYATTERACQPGLALRALFRSAERRTMRALPPDTSAIVSTHPAASQVLGALRRRGGLTVPTLTYLTDFSVHPLWVAPGVDAHMAVHAIPAEQARAQGAAAVTVTGPVVNPAFTPATPAERRAAARARFGLPERDWLALLVAGSWGVGSVREAATEILNTGIAVPVVVCGRNGGLRDRLRQDGIGHAFGWVDDMPGLMRACDIVVQNAGGLSSLEAFASGLPVASYRCIPGHGRANAAALEEAGLAAWIREPDQLKPVLAGLLEGTLGRQQRAEALALYRSGPSPAGVIAAAVAGGIAAAVAGRRVTARTKTGRRPARRQRTVVAATVAAVLCLGISAGVGEGHMFVYLHWLAELIEAHHR
jgi:UDP-N-acetylglucosamine:LPS N-acetylglucosamine transferase